jgi:predicted  nucleic acid-binding Zn-ribbon protein
MIFNFISNSLQVQLLVFKLKKAVMCKLIYYEGIKMKFLPLKTMILCFILPPVFYAATIYSSNKYFISDYEAKIKNILLINSADIYAGKITLENALEKNIVNFTNKDFLLKKDLLNIEVLVADKSGTILYPVSAFSENRLEQGFKLSSSAVAKANFEILEKGLETKVNVTISNTLRFITALFYFSIAFFAFILRFTKARNLYLQYENQRLEQIKKLEQEEQTYKNMLLELENEKKNLSSKISSLREKYSETRSSEEEMLDEIISLEEKLQTLNDSQTHKEQEVNELREKLEELEKKKNVVHRKKDFDFLSKRFETLYKNVIMTKKAYEGFGELDEDLQIKAEELIHLLNNEPENVIIKRKVFSGKKSKNTSFEVIFGYTGRLYFSKNKDNKTKIVLIGTKNTQHKDMDYLHNL